MNTKTLCGALILWLALQCMSTNVAEGDIVNTTGDVEVVFAPASVRRNSYNNNHTARVFAEREKLNLPSVLINAVDPGRYDAYADFQDETISNPVLIDSYFLHFDPIGVEGFAQGTITFSQPMLGVIGRSLTMAQTDDTLGSVGTLYPTNRFNREPEYRTRGNYDYFELSNDMKTLSFRFRATDLDQIRIVVRSVPEPASFVFIFCVTGLVTTTRQRKIASC